MSRSLKKGPYVEPNLYHKVVERGLGISEPLKTWARACTILPEFVGRTFLVHNGKDFRKVLITENMVGHKLGEFALTRNYRGHGGEKQK